MTGSCRGGGPGAGAAGYPIYPVIGLAGPLDGAGGNLCIAPGRVVGPGGGICCRGAAGGGTCGLYGGGCGALATGVEAGPGGLCAGIPALDVPGLGAAA